MRAEAPTLNRRRDLGEVFRDSFALYRADWQGFVIIAAATIPFSLLLSAAQLSLDERMRQQLAISGAFLVSLPFLSVIEGAIIAYLAGIGLGPPVSEGQAFRAALGRAPALIGAFVRVVAVCAVLFATIIGIPVAIYLLVRWVFVAQAVMLDGASGSASLGASSRLVQGVWWATLGRGLVIAAFVIAINIVVLGLVASGPEAIYALVSAIVGAFTTPYLAIAFTLMYFDLKARKAEAVGSPLP